MSYEKLCLQANSTEFRVEEPDDQAPSVVVALERTAPPAATMLSPYARGCWRKGSCGYRCRGHRTVGTCRGEHHLGIRRQVHSQHDQAQGRSQSTGASPAWSVASPSAATGQAFRALTGFTICPLRCPDGAEFPSRGAKASRPDD